MVFRGINKENWQTLMGTLTDVYGPEAVEEMTVGQVIARHRELIELLDGRREIGGVEIDDAQMDALTAHIDRGEEARQLRNALQEVVARRKAKKNAMSD